VKHEGVWTKQTPFTAFFERGAMISQSPTGMLPVKKRFCKSAVNFYKTWQPNYDY